MLDHLENVSEIRCFHGLVLEHARDEFLSRFPDETVLRPLRDRQGIVGYEAYYRILCAKKYIYGSIVSCHEMLVRRAIEQEKWLLMYILKNNKFYLFNPSRIMESGVRNFRGGERMINFEIKRGVNAETGQKDEL